MEPSAALNENMSAFLSTKPTLSAKTVCLIRCFLTTMMSVLPGQAANFQAGGEKPTQTALHCITILWIKGRSEILLFTTGFKIFCIWIFFCWLIDWTEFGPNCWKGFDHLSPGSGLGSLTVPGVSNADLLVGFGQPRHNLVMNTLMQHLVNTVGKKEILLIRLISLWTNFSRAH